MGTPVWLGAPSLSSYLYILVWQKITLQLFSDELIAKIEAVVTGKQARITLEWKNTSENNQTKLVPKAIKLKSDISVHTYQIHTYRSIL